MSNTEQQKQNTAQADTQQKDASSHIDAPSESAPQNSDSKTAPIPEGVFGQESTTPTSTLDTNGPQAEQSNTAPPIDPTLYPGDNNQPKDQASKQNASAPAEKKEFKFKSSGLGSKSAEKSKPKPKPASPTQKQGDDASQSNIPRGALNAVVTRNEYYRDGYRNIIKLALIQALVVVGLIVTFIVYINIHKGQDRYFATTADGRILQLIPLDQPNMSSAALLSWVSQSATEVMTFGFHDYQRRLQDSSRHFTRRGWESFTTALQRSRIIESVESLQQVVTAAPRSAPVLIQEGIFNGRYRWVVRLPLTVTFRSGNNSTSSNLEVTITIERVPTLESPNGVGIESWIAV